MWNRCFQFIVSHAYLIGGTLVVAALTLATGAFTLAVIGYSVSYGLVTVIEKLTQ